MRGRRVLDYQPPPTWLDSPKDTLVEGVFVCLPAAGVGVEVPGCWPDARRVLLSTTNEREPFTTTLWFYGVLLMDD